MLFSNSRVMTISWYQIGTKITRFKVFSDNPDVILKHFRELLLCKVDLL